MKKPLVVRFVLTLLICAALCFSLPVLIHRHEFDKAFTEFKRNPTPLTQAAVEQQRLTNDRIALTVRICGTIVLFLIVNAAWSGVSALRQTALRISTRQS